MAGQIQGLTVIINGDATPFTRAMRKLKGETTTLSAHMRALNKAIKFDPTSTTLLTRRQQLYNSLLANTTARLAGLRQMNEEYAKRAGALTTAEQRQWQNVQRQITETELKYAELQAQARAYGTLAPVGLQRTAGALAKTRDTLAKVSTGFLVTSAAAGILGAAVVKSAYDFEDSFAGVRKTIIATNEEYERLARISRDIALEKPIDVNDVNEIMMYAGQLNIATEYLGKFTATMADLDVATDMDLEEGSMQLARFMNIVGMSQNDVDRLGATIVDLGNNSATTESQIMLMGMRIAGTGSNLGMTASDIMGVASSLSAMGIQAEMGGNAISTIMRRIDKDVAAGGARLELWAQTAGMSADEFAQSWSSDVTGTLADVMEGMNRYQQEGNNLNVLLGDLGINYMRQIDVIQRLSRNSDLLRSNTQRASKAFADNTALTREANQRYDTAASKLQMMKNAFNEAALAIGQEILPDFKDLVLGVTDAVKAFAQMDSGTKSFIITAGGVAVALGLAVKAVELFAGAGAKVAGAVSSLVTWIAQARAATVAQTAMTAASTAAVGVQTEVIDLNTGAVVANAAATDTLTASTSALATAKTALASPIAGLGVSLGAYLAVLVAAAAATYLIASNTDTMAKEMDKSSSATRAQEANVESLRSKYEESVSALGENADETRKAYSEWKTASDELENTSETLGEFVERVNAASEEYGTFSDNLRDGMDEARSESGALLAMADDIEALANAGGGDGIGELSAKISALNLQMPDLNMWFDETTGTLKSNEGAWESTRRAVEEYSDSIMYNKALETYNNALSQQDSLLSTLSQAQDEYNAKMDELAAQNGGTIDQFALASLRSSDLAQALDAASAAVERNESDMQTALDTITQFTSRESALTEAIGQVAAGYMTADEAAAKYSSGLETELTAEEILEERKRRTAEAMQEETAATDELANKIGELADKSDVFAEWMAVTGTSAEELAARFANIGVDAETAAKGIEEVFKAATDGTGRLTDSGKQALDDWLGNLESNSKAVSDWADNIQYLYSQAEGNQVEFLDAVRELGPEYSAAVEKLAKNTRKGGDNLSNAANRWEKSIKRGARAAKTAYTDMGTNSEKASKKIGTSSDKAATTSTKAWTSMADGAKKGASDSTNAANTMSSGVASAMKSPASGAFGWGASAGSNYAAGLRSKASEVSGAAAMLADMQRKKLGHSIAEEGPLHNQGKGEIGWGEHAVENYVKGLESRRNMLAGAVSSLAQTTADGMRAVRFGMQAVGAGGAQSYGSKQVNVNLTLNIDRSASDDDRSLVSTIAGKLEDVLSMEE